MATLFNSLNLQNRVTTSKLQLGTVPGLCQSLNRAWELTARMLPIQNKTVPGSLSTINPYRQESSVQGKVPQNYLIYLYRSSSSFWGMYFLYLTPQSTGWNSGAIITLQTPLCYVLTPRKNLACRTPWYYLTPHNTVHGTCSAWPVQQQSQRIWSISLHLCPGWPSASLIRTQVTTGPTGNHISG